MKVNTKELVNNENGYMAIKNNNLIIEYNTDAERSRLCYRNKGKKYKFDVDYKIVEDWLLEKNRKNFKVKCNKMTFYFDNKEEAQKRASSYNSQVETLEVITEIVIAENNVNLQEATVNEIDSYIDNNVQAMIEFIVNLNVMHKELYERLSVLDRKVVDIEHAMEFQKLDAAGGYKLYKLMHDTLNERRVLKDNIKKIETLQKSHLADNIKIANKNINKIENQKYTPRVLNELFA